MIKLFSILFVRKIWCTKGSHIGPRLFIHFINDIDTKYT